MWLTKLNNGDNGRPGGKKIDAYPRTHVASPILDQVYAFDVEVYARATADTATQADSMFWRPQQLSSDELSRLRLTEAKAWAQMLQGVVQKEIDERGDSGVPVLSAGERKARTHAEKEAEDMNAEEEAAAELPEHQEGLRSPRDAGYPLAQAKHAVPGCLLHNCIELERLRVAARATQWQQTR